MNISNIHEFRSHGYESLAGKIIAMGAILPNELPLIKSQTHIGDTIKYFIDGTAELGKGEVLKKYEHHVLVRTGNTRTSVCWVDVIRGKK